MTEFNSGALGAAGTYGLTGTEIYRNFHAGTGDDGRGLVSAAQSVSQLSDHYDRRVESITRLTGQMESAWQGDAAGAARRGAAPLAVEHARAQQDMNVAEQVMVNQVDVFDGAKSSVREVPPTPEKPGMWDNLTSLGGAGRSYENDMNQVNSANDVNVAVMQTYEGETQSNADRMPITYGSLSPDDSSIGVREPIVWPPEHRVEPPGGDDEGSNNNNTSNNNTTTPNQNRTPGEFSTRPPGGDPTGPGTTSPNQFDPPRQTEPPRNVQPVGPGPGPGQNPNLPPGMAPGGFGQGRGPGGGGGPGGGRGPGGGFGPRGGGGFGPGGGGAGAGGAGAGSGAGARGGGGFGPGGAGAAAAADGAAGRGGAGAGGGAGGGRGAGGMGGMGGGRGQGKDDNEHERPSFLVEPDPHDTFGTDEVTAPPVIGE